MRWYSFIYPIFIFYFVYSDNFWHTCECASRIHGSSTQQQPFRLALLYQWVLTLFRRRISLLVSVWDSEGYPGQRDGIVAVGRRYVISDRLWESVEVLPLRYLWVDDSLEGVSINSLKGWPYNNSTPSIVCHTSTIIISRSPLHTFVHCLIYAFSFVFHASWHQNLCLLDFLAILPTSKSDR